MRIERRYKDQNGNKPATLGTVGHIRIGEKKTNAQGKEYPVSLDYFKGDAPEQYLAFFRDAFGDKPTKITITFLSNDQAEVCRQFYELRDDKGKRVAYGNGRLFYVATLQSDKSVVDVVHEPNDPDKFMDDLEKTARGKWRERLVLRFALPQIPVLGLWEFSTHGSGSTIPNIVGTIDTMMEVAGRIAGIPFDLIVEKVKSDKAGQTSVYPVVKLIPNISQESAEIVRGLPIQLGTILTEARIAQLAGAQLPSGQVQQETDDEGFADYEEISAPDNDELPAGPEPLDLDDLKDKISQCLSFEALAALFAKDNRHESKGIKELFTEQKKEIKRLKTAGQIQ